VPNLNAGRSVGVAGFVKCLNVRRLMYQTLIWSAELRDETSGLRTPLHAERVERLTDALVDSMGGDPKLVRDLLGRQMLVDQAQAIELAVGESRDPRSYRVLCRP